MTIDVDVRVSENYRRVAREIKAAADGGLRREMTKAIASAAKPAQAAVKAAVPSYMPGSGGYAATLQAALRLRTVRRAGGVRITAEADGAGGKRDVGAREKGSLRHPVYGRFRVSHRRRSFIERPWVNQRIRPGFFTEPIQDRKNDIRDEIAEAIQRLADQIAR